MGCRLPRLLLTNTSCSSTTLFLPCPSVPLYTRGFAELFISYVGSLFVDTTCARLVVITSSDPHLPFPHVFVLACNTEQFYCTFPWPRRRVRDHSITLESVDPFSAYSFNRRNDKSIKTSLLFHKCPKKSRKIRTTFFLRNLMSNKYQKLFV